MDRSKQRRASWLRTQQHGALAGSLKAYVNPWLIVAIVTGVLIYLAMIVPDHHLRHASALQKVADIPLPRGRCRCSGCTLNTWSASLLIHCCAMRCSTLPRRSSND